MALLYIIVHHKAMASRKAEQQLTKRRRTGKKTIILRHKSFESWCKLFHYQGEETLSSSIFLAFTKYAFEESEMAPVHFMPARWCFSASRPRGKSSVRREEESLEEFIWNSNDSTFFLVRLPHWSADAREKLLSFFHLIFNRNPYQTISLEKGWRRWRNFSRHTDGADYSTMEDS